MYGDQLANEKARFSQHLGRLPGLRPRPSTGDWILIETENPGDLAKKVNRRVKNDSPGLQESPLTVPRGIERMLRIRVGKETDNQRVFEVLQEVTRPPRKRYRA